ncbi:hypothetical protein [Zunongwangia sp. HRR-M8]|nr:hypothetical protein [Zunongwangia sp. HRR-M8]WBL24027.1 hypothetical protein PBT89_04820 [Zunongwangia sp. HRR-M8]
MTCLDENTSFRNILKLSNDSYEYNNWSSFNFESIPMVLGDMGFI